MSDAPESANGEDANPFAAFSSNLLAPALNYWVDATQRSLLFWDVMGRRADQYREHLAEAAPNVLSYDADLVLDGRTFERPVNYVLVRMKPPKGVEIDDHRRPFVVVDPRAGHGPGIGGFKAESEIGVAFKAGHPCYFIGFLTEPVPGQTIEDIAHAQAIFLEHVIAQHPEAEGKPCVIGNCQAGWAIMMLAALRPELFGTIIAAGSPLSYWAGVRGKNPMRYSGGLLGGSWLTALTSDLGRGKFDGAWLVQNFENQNPSNTLWTKQYNLYANIDTEADRYLTFERWWGGHVYLNAEEIQFIVDELFVGNHLASGDIKTTGGVAVDLRNIRAPILVFCSEGDNITPPQQALGWILDLYDDVNEIRAFGQTIVYTVHDTIGHLGIFVSGGVARKEYREFSSNIDMIDVLPPGLYEAVLEPKTKDMEGTDLVAGDWVMRCEARTLDDIRAMGGNDPADERRFATAAKLSEANLALYQTYLQPLVRNMVPEAAAEPLRQMHPLRVSYEFFSNANPMMAPIRAMADQVRKERKPVDADNPFLAMERKMSDQIVSTLDAYRDMTEKASEATFLAIYGAAGLQSALGVDPKDDHPPRKAAKTALHREVLQRRIADLRERIGVGGLQEALIRSLLYVGCAHGSADERGFTAIRRMRASKGDQQTLTLGEFKSLIRDQFLMLIIDEEAAIQAIPQLLHVEEEAKREALATLQEVLSGRGELIGESIERWRRISQLFGAKSGATIPPTERKIVERVKVEKTSAPIAPQAH